MTTKTKTKVSKTIISEKELMHKTITTLTSIVSQLEHDVKKVKTRLGI